MDSLPYESAYASAFVYALGMLEGHQRGTDNLSAQLGIATLLYQNPFDQTLGDAITGWDGKFCLIEFKRSESEFQKEREKQQRKRLLATLQQIGDYERKISDVPNTRVRLELRVEATTKGLDLALLPRAMRCHFLGYGDKHETDAIWFLPYPCLNETEIPRDRRILMGDFIRNLQNPAGSVGLDGSEFREYIDAVVRFSGEEEGTVENVTGFLVGLNADGQAMLIRYSGLSQLVQLLRQSAHQRRARAQRPGGLKST